MKRSKNTARPNSTWTPKDEAIYQRGEREANKRIKLYGKMWALELTEDLEFLAEELDMNSYGLAQEFVRQFRSIWKRA